MIQVKTAQTTSEVDRILRFRYQIEIEELGKQKLHADHARKVIADDLDTPATHVYAESDGKILGALRRTSLTAAGLPEGLQGAVDRLGFERWGRDRLIFNSRFMIAPEVRGTRVFTQLIQHSYEIGRDSGMLFEFLYCRPRLSSLYRRVGFRACGESFRDADGVASIPMVMAVPRTERLRDYATPKQDHPDAALVSRATSWLDQRLAGVGASRCQRCHTCQRAALCVSV